VAILGRVFLVLIIGAFPIGVYLFARTGHAPGSPAPSKELATSKLSSISTAESLDLINKGIESKAIEIKEINVQILENRGKILRLEDERQNKLKALQELQVKLSTIIEDAIPKKTTTIQ